MNKENIFIIGCGGNGSWFIDHILKNHERFKDYFRFYLIDPDIVESKNITRQNFSMAHIHRFKSYVLVNQLRDIGIEAFPIINTENIKFTVIPSYVFIFVDNMYARRYYYEKILKQFNNNIKLWIDVGNGYYDGQIFFINNNIDFTTKSLYETYLNNTTDIIEEKPCANMPEQNIYINKIMAYISFKYFLNFINNDPYKFSFYRFSVDKGDNISQKILQIYYLFYTGPFLLFDRFYYEMPIKKLIFGLIVRPYYGDSNIYVHSFYNKLMANSNFLNMGKVYIGFEPIKIKIPHFYKNGLIATKLYSYDDIDLSNTSQIPYEKIIQFLLSKRSLKISKLRLYFDNDLYFLNNCLKLNYTHSILNPITSNLKIHFK